MGFSFLTPLFLVGLAALAVPIIVHLTHSARRDVVPFPSLMFVRRIPFRSMRRQRIRHWLLFALRCAAILLLVAAFARPLLDRSADAAMALSRAREVVVLLDRSYSMGHGDRWERAREAAGRAIAGLGQDDRATLITFAERVESVSQRTADPAALRASLDAAELGYAGTRYAPALQAAGEIVQRTDRPRSEVILISDFQRVGWDASEVSRLPAGTSLTVVDVSEPGAANAAVANVMIERDRRPGGERVAVAARIVNFGADALKDQEVRLELEGVGTRVQNVDIGSGETVTVGFDPLSLPQRLTRGTVRLAADRLAVDDAFHFVVRPDPPVRVLLAGSNDASLLYVRRVLEIGEHPAFDVTVARGSRLNPGHFEGQDVVILHDMSPPSGDAARVALTEFVRGGGGLLLVLGRRTLPAAWEPLEPLLPGSFGAPVDQSADGGSTLSSLNRKHPVFEIFRAPRSGDFTAARFFRYREVRPGPGATVLARFNDGSAALTEAGIGEGRVLVWATDLENFWNDLVVQPVFLPLLQSMASYLGDYKSPTLWLPAGEVLDLSTGGDRELVAALQGELILEEPGGGRAVLRPDRETMLLELSGPGFYEIRRASGGEGSRSLYTLAVNLDVAESDLATVDPTEVAGAAVSQAEGERRLGADVSELLTPKERERRQGLWWYLLAGALSLLLLESVLSNTRGRVSPGRARTSAG